MQLALDIELYPNYFLLMVMDEQGRTKSFDWYGDDDFVQYSAMAKLLKWNPDVEFVTFNGINYDMPILALLCSGWSQRDMKSASDDIINNNLSSWQFYKKYQVDQLNINHVDLMEVAIGQSGLKLYGGRLHSEKLRELPYDPSRVLTRAEADEVRRYCRNDLKLTWGLMRKLESQIDLRRAMGKQYGVDLRSKSDAQIAEAVLKAEYTRITGREPKKVEITYKQFKYVPPSYIRFSTDELRSAFDTIKNADFVIKDTGHVEMPTEIDKMVITINGRQYKVGIGGLHSQESEVSHYSSDVVKLFDIDVTSYYPSLMLNMGMSPLALGGHFQDIYRKILEERVAAKDSGDKVKADALKITLNGTFGKTSNKYSILYNPEMMIRTTLSGQLSLLMLIEKLEQAGIPVVSANTDGIVAKCPVAKLDWLKAIVEKWEKVTNLRTEWKEYLALHSRDVNNYIAIPTKGDVKVKGVYRTGDISKNPQNEICAEAAIAFLKDDVPYEDTIRNCTDIRKFLTLRTVNGGAVKDEKFLGKAIRWYYAKGEKGHIKYKTNGNTVPRSEGAMPLMDLPSAFPSDVDYDWYIEECRHVLMDLGAIERPVQAVMPRKNSKAWKELVATGQVAIGHKGDWVWTTK